MAEEIIELHKASDTSGLIELSDKLSFDEVGPLATVSFLDRLAE